MQPTLEFRHRRHKCQVCVNIEVTACITSASAANRLLARCFLRCSKRWKILGPILLTGLVTWYGTTAGKLLTIRLWHDSALRLGSYWQSTCDMIRHYGWEVMDNPLVTRFGTTAGKLLTIRLWHDTALRLGSYWQSACDMIRHYGWEVMDNPLVTW